MTFILHLVSSSLDFVLSTEDSCPQCMEERMGMEIYRSWKMGKAEAKKVDERNDMMELGLRPNPIKKVHCPCKNKKEHQKQQD